MPTPKVTFTLALTVPQHEALRDVARARGVPMAKLARDAILVELFGLHDALADHAEAGNDARP